MKTLASRVRNAIKQVHGESMSKQGRAYTEPRKNSVRIKLWFSSVPVSSQLEEKMKEEFGDRFIKIRSTKHFNVPSFAVYIKEA